MRPRVNLTGASEAGDELRQEDHAKLPGDSGSARCSKESGEEARRGRKDKFRNEKEKNDVLGAELLGPRSPCSPSTAPATK